MNIPFIIWIACFIELITYILRFGFNVHSKTMQQKFNFPMRVHHMYLGILLVIPGFFFPITLFPDFILNGVAITFLDIGLAIMLSDMIHHFSILPLFHQKIDFP
ncbi:MAG: hypothetical protein QT08_C0008G0004 [archaeon GW2011_AR17]|nr:MAG: hypothetical protein QT08_C0008G0004 [archaeon GW2011_AR17]MBS3153768.1 hypothetical protein [Candidatus Woesearchaeota archaeon]HIJ04536.1 hypothetical protein [Nanoarchaeota archaeon]